MNIERVVEYAGQLNQECLRAVLDGNGVDRDSYCRDGGYPPERYELEDRRSEWVVYHLERLGTQLPGRRVLHRPLQ
jgi:hypothetical protein